MSNVVLKINITKTELNFSLYKLGPYPKPSYIPVMSIPRVLTLQMSTQPMLSPITTQQPSRKQLWHTENSLCWLLGLVLGEMQKYIIQFIS